MGKIYYIMGKSASGKDSLYRKLLERKPGLKTYVMYTTRPIRSGEKDGEAYRFTDCRTIEALRKAGKLIEARTYNTVKGPWTYATADDGQIDLASGDYLAVGTLESFIKLKEYFGEESVVPVYIETEDGERLIRAVKREQAQSRPDYRELCRRFLADAEDFSEERLKDAGITRVYTNLSIEDCLDEIIGVME